MEGNQLFVPGAGEKFVMTFLDITVSSVTNKWFFINVVTWFYLKKNHFALHLLSNSYD